MSGRLAEKVRLLDEESEKKHAAATKQLEEAKAANRAKFDAVVADYKKAKQEFLQFKHFHSHTKFKKCEEKLTKLEGLHWENSSEEKKSLALIYTDHAKFCERPTWNSNIDPVKNKIRKLNTCSASERTKYEGELATVRSNAEEFLAICEEHKLIDTTQWRTEFRMTLASIKPVQQPEAPPKNKLETTKAKVNEAEDQLKMATRNQIDKIIQSGESIDAIEAKSHELDANADKFKKQPGKSSKPKPEPTKNNPNAPSKSRWSDCWASLFDCSNWCSGSNKKEQTLAQPAPDTNDARAKLLSRD